MNHLFFCFGMPKSGTTFLQRMINLHPEVYCPSEHNFDFINNKLKLLLDDYNRVIKVVDHRTGGQGVQPLSPDLHLELFKHAVESIALGGAGKKKIVGVNDNAVVTKIPAYDNLFDSPKFIAIFRNPVDTAISAWHHNLRLAKEENNPEHKLMMTRHGGIEEWVTLVANNFSENVKNCINFKENNNNILIVRYEDFLKNKPDNLVRLFDFLGASTDKKIINKIDKKSTLSVMRKSASNKDFFRSGLSDMGKGVVSDKLREVIDATESEALKYLGYDLVCQRVYDCDLS